VTGPEPGRNWDARTYDRVADPQTRWGRVVLDRLPLTGDERVLDAGCGSGRVTELLAQRVPDGSVVALDASDAMVDAARQRLAPYGDRIEFVVADLGEPLPLAEPVDAILSTATFHWVPNHDALFANLAAVVRPGGWLVAQCGGAGNIASIRFEVGEPFETFLRTVILGAHVQRLPADEREAFVRSVAERLPEPVVDYVRLNITARRSRR
jgi:trans-aconitate 2-methyltransferase